MEILQLKNDLIIVAQSFSGSLPEVGINDVIGFVKVGELKLALEVLCDILHEDSIHVPNETYARISSIGELLGVNKSYWEDLRKP